MAQAGKLAFISTDPASDFRAALATDAGINLALSVASLGLGQRVDALIQSLQIISVENLAWELWVWASSAYNGSATNPAIPQLRGRWAFTESSGKQIGGAGLYYYAIDGLRTPVFDDEAQGRVYLTLVNRSVASKTANDGGMVLVQLGLEPTLGW